ncbi:MAG: hypothetical protein HQK82_12240, partial [Desulfovibrionaceae bacterium]|nr:hypothetical protein [Desulfovibrionaceae bacterium]
MRFLSWTFSLFLHLTVVLAGLLWSMGPTLHVRLDVPVYEVELVDVAPGPPPGPGLKPEAKAGYEGPGSDIRLPPGPEISKPASSPQQPVLPEQKAEPATPAPPKPDQSVQQAAEKAAAEKAAQQAAEKAAAEKAAQAAAVQKAAAEKAAAEKLLSEKKAAEEKALAEKKA